MLKGRIFTAYYDGIETECEVIMMYHSIITNFDYVFYTDNDYDDDGNLNLYASRYLGEDDGQMILEDIASEEEWNLLDDALEKAKEGLIRDGR